MITEKSTIHQKLPFLYFSDNNQLFRTKSVNRRSISDSMSYNTCENEIYKTAYDTVDDMSKLATKSFITPRSILKKPTDSFQRPNNVKYGTCVAASQNRVKFVDNLNESDEDLSFVSAKDFPSNYIYTPVSNVRYNHRRISVIPNTGYTIKKQRNFVKEPIKFITDYKNQTTSMATTDEFKTATDNMERLAMLRSKSTVSKPKNLWECEKLPKNLSSKRSHENSLVDFNTCDNENDRRTHQNIVETIIDISPQLAEVDKKLKEIIENLRHQNADSSSDRFADSEGTVTDNYKEKSKVTLLQTNDQTIHERQKNEDNFDIKSTNVKKNGWSNFCHWIKNHCLCCCNR